MNKQYRLSALHYTDPDNTVDTINTLHEENNVIRAEHTGNLMGDDEIEITVKMRAKTLEEAKKEAPELAQEIANAEVFVVCELVKVFDEQDL